MTQRTLALVGQYQGLVEAILDDYSVKTGVIVEAPADHLTDLCRHLRWGLRFVPLPPDRWAECDTAARGIRITADLPKRLAYPGAARAMVHKCIAHELAHAVLHADKPRSRATPRSWEYEARLFAQVLLTPWRALSARPELPPLRRNWLTQRERWARVHELAEVFRVTPSLMVSTLCLYGVLERLPGGGLQAPVVLASYARPLSRRPVGKSEGDL